LIEAILVNIPVAESTDVRVLHIVYIYIKFAAINTERTMSRYLIIMEMIRIEILY